MSNLMNRDFSERLIVRDIAAFGVAKSSSARNRQVLEMFREFVKVPGLQLDNWVVA